MNYFKYIFLSIMIFAAVQMAAQETTKVTEIAIVEDTAPDNVKINGKDVSVYQLQSLDVEPEYPGGVNGLDRKSVV